MHSKPHERLATFDLVSRNDLYVHISYRRSRLPTSHEGDHEHSLSIKLYETIGSVGIAGNDLCHPRRGHARSE